MNIVHAETINLDCDIKSEYVSVKTKSVEKKEGKVYVEIKKNNKIVDIEMDSDISSVNNIGVTTMKMLGREAEDLSSESRWLITQKSSRNGTLFKTTININRITGVLIVNETMSDERSIAEGKIEPISIVKVLGQCQNIMSNKNKF